VDQQATADVDDDLDIDPGAGRNGHTGPPAERENQVIDV
jgi:hypothetical protein